jgi:hypothetical protein
MNRVTAEAFADELGKIASMVKYTKPRPKTKLAGRPGKEANRFFGLPVFPPKRGVRCYENAPSAAQSADRSQSPIAGQMTPSVGAANVISPASGPGGV